MRGGEVCGGCLHYITTRTNRCEGCLCQTLENKSSFVLFFLTDGQKVVGFTKVFVLICTLQRQEQDKWATGSCCKRCHGLALPEGSLAPRVPVQVCTVTPMCHLCGAKRFLLSASLVSWCMHPTSDQKAQPRHSSTPLGESVRNLPNTLVTGPAKCEAADSSHEDVAGDSCAKQQQSLQCYESHPFLLPPAIHSPFHLLHYRSPNTSPFLQSPSCRHHRRRKYQNCTQHVIMSEQCSTSNLNTRNKRNPSQRKHASLNLHSTCLLRPKVILCTAQLVATLDQRRTL